MERVGFYRQDIRIFSELGFDLVCTNRLSQVFWDCDLYISWFPYWGALLWPVAAITRKPHITIGAIDAAMPASLRKRGWRSLALLLMEKWTIQHATVCLPISYFEEKVFLNVGARRTKMIYLGIETDKYSFDPCNDHRQHINQVLTITHLNEQNYRRKCVGSVIECIPHVVKDQPDVQFVLCGRQDAGVMKRIKHRVQTLGIERHVQFPGNIDDDEKLRYLRESTVYLQPTLYEGFGLAMAEAMSCGLPVVTSPVGSVPEVVGNVGLFSPGDNVQLLSRQVSRLLADPALRINLGQAGRDRICQKFSYPVRRKQIAQVVEELMGDRVSAQITRNITQFKQDGH